MQRRKADKHFIGHQNSIVPKRENTDLSATQYTTFHDERNNKIWRRLNLFAFH